MNELECRNENCEEVVSCEEGVLNVTCSYCCATMGVCVEENQYGIIKRTCTRLVRTIWL